MSQPSIPTNQSEGKIVTAEDAYRDVLRIMENNKVHIVHSISGTRGTGQMIWLGARVYGDVLREVIEQRRREAAGGEG